MVADKQCPILHLVTDHHYWHVDLSAERPLDDAAHALDFVPMWPSRLQAGQDGALFFLRDQLLDSPVIHRVQDKRLQMHFEPSNKRISAFAVDRAETLWTITLAEEIWWEARDSPPQQFAPQTKIRLTRSDMSTVWDTSETRLWIHDVDGFFAIPTAEKAACQSCAHPSPPFKCFQCQLAHYCSIDCRRQDWLVHRLFCQRCNTEDSSQAEENNPLKHFILGRSTKPYIAMKPKRWITQ